MNLYSYYLYTTLLTRNKVRKPLMKKKTLRLIALICAATMLTSLPAFAEPAPAPDAWAAGEAVSSDEEAAAPEDAAETAPVPGESATPDAAPSDEPAAAEPVSGEDEAAAAEPASGEDEAAVTDAEAVPQPADEAAEGGDALPEEALEETEETDPLMEADGEEFSREEDGYRLTFMVTSEADKEVNCKIAQVYRDSGINVVIPETVSYSGKTYTVTGMPQVSQHPAYQTIDSSIAAAIETVSFPSTMKTIHGNLFNWHRKKATEEELGIPHYSGNRNVEPIPDTEATLMDIPAFIKNHYTDGCYYAGKCLVRVDPNYRGDLAVKPGTVCILASALEGCTKIGKVTLPDSVEYIGMFAFANSGVTAVNLPKNLKKSVDYRVQYGAFYNCQALEEVKVEASTLDHIPMVCFYNCRSLKGFDFSKVTAVEAYAFANAFAPGTKVSLGSSCQIFGISPFAGSGVGELSVDSNIICTAFMDCKSLANDVLGESDVAVKYVDHRSFANTAMTTLTIPSCIEYMAGAAFMNNTSLKTLNWYGSNMSSYSPLFAYLGDGTQIANHPRYSSGEDMLDVFEDVPEEGGTAIETLNIYGGLDAKSSNASIYQMMPSLKTVNIKYSVTEIPDQVFYADTGLKEINLSDPSKLKKVAVRAFALTGLEEAVVMKGVTYGPCVFQGDKYLKKVVVESGATELGDFMFERCEALEQVSLPASLKKVNWAAFKDAGNGTRFYLSKNVTLIEDDAFALSSSSMTGPRGLEIILAGDPTIETVHPLPASIPMRDGDNYWLPISGDSVVYTKMGPAYQAYKTWVETQEASGPDEEPLPMIYEASYTGPSPVELGTTISKSMVKAVIDGETLPESQYDLLGSTKLETPGFHQITVRFPPLIYGTTSIGQDTISARFLSDTAKKGPVYRFEQANIQTVEVQATRFASVAGGNRYKTAAEIAKKAFPTAPAEAILVTGENFPDALSANAYAGAKNAPVLLSKLSELPQPTKDLLTKTWSKSVKTVTIIGGGFDKKVETALKGCGVTTIKHIAGKNRYKTAEEVCKAGIEEKLWNMTWPVAIATGQTSADALAFSPWSYGLHLPILLAKNGEVSASTKTLISKFGFVIMLGSSSTVKDSCLSSAQKAAHRYERLAGSNRFKTSLAIAKYFVGTAHMGSYGGAAYADGTDEHFPDALVGGMLQGQLRAPIILTKPGQKDVKSFTTGTMNNEDVITSPVYFLGWAAKGKSTEYDEITKLLKQNDGPAVPQS